MFGSKPTPVELIINEGHTLQGQFASYGPGSRFPAGSEREAESMIAAGYARRATPADAAGAKPADQAETPEARMVAKRERR